MCSLKHAASLTEAHACNICKLSRTAKTLSANVHSPAHKQPCHCCRALACLLLPKLMICAMPQARRPALVPPCKTQTSSRVCECIMHAAAPCKITTISTDDRCIGQKALHLPVAPVLEMMRHVLSNYNSASLAPDLCNVET